MLGKFDYKYLVKYNKMENFWNEAYFIGIDYIETNKKIGKKIYIHKCKLW